MKIVLISPYNNLNSYGIRSISTYLRSRGIVVSTIYLLNNFNHPYHESIFNQLGELCSDADLIGISVMSNYFVNCVQITEQLKKRLSVPIVWGGVHPTFSPLECLKYCDIVVRGEGEKTSMEILNRMERKEPVTNILGTFVKEREHIYQNNLRPPMTAENLIILDNDYSSDYILIKNKLRKINFSILKNYLTRDYITLTSFGCPFSCSYCLNNKLKSFYGEKMRFRAVDDVMKELVWVKEKMPFIKHISFDDDAFILRDVGELKEFAIKYKEKINLPFFVSGINPMLVTDDKIQVLLSAGLDRLRMGVQSGSDKARAMYNRNISNDKIISSANIINKYRHKLLLTGFDLILDNPFEIKTDVIETIRLLSELPSPFTLNLFSLTFFPGTGMYERALAAGLIDDNIDNVYKKHYHDIKVNYLNFIILLFTVFKVPNWILNFLLKEKFVDRDIKIPKILFEFIKFLGYSRRGVNFLLKGDPYTLGRHLKLGLIKS